MNPSMMLSRYPFASPPRVYVLPSTSYRRSVLYAPIQLQDQVIDFFCAQLSTPIIGTELPYEGDYGSDVAPDGGISNGYEQEQDLQVQRLVALVQSVTAADHHVAIVAGDWHASLASSSPAADGGAPQVVDALSPEVIEALDQAHGGAFAAAEPPGFADTCNYCSAPTNLYNVGDPPYDLNRTFLSGFEVASTTEDSFWDTANDAVALTPSTYAPLPPGSTGMGPLFEYYPRTVHILRPLVH